MSADGRYRAHPRHEEQQRLTQAESATLLSQLTAASQRTDPRKWAEDILEHTIKHQHPPRAEAALLPAYYATAQGKPEVPEQIKDAARRAYARGEAERDLRASMRAQVILAQHGQVQEADWLRRYHAERWRIAEVSQDYSERERQIADALKHKYGR